MSLIKVHSWLPFAMSPFELVEEHNVAIHAGATLISQNLLSNSEAFFSWGWNRSEGSMYRLGFRYFGLGPHIDIEGQYGGNQMVYSLMQWNPETESFESQPLPHSKPYYSASISLRLPLFFQQGYHTRQLSLSAGWGYSNGLVANLKRIRYDESQQMITNLAYIGYIHGLHKLTFGAGFSDVVQQAPRDFAPRWGYALYADYALNPTNSSFSDLISFYGKVWLPGFVRHHSLMVALDYQTSLGGFTSRSGMMLLTYKSTRLLPRGFSSADITSDRYAAASVDYQLPLWHPEGGIPSVLYIKRIRLNIGLDGARFRTAGGVQRLWSAGGDLLFDLNLFRQPAAATGTVKLSFYRPSHGPFWFTAGLGLPF